MAGLIDVVAPPRFGRPFRWLLGSSWTSNLGDGIALAAGPLLVASQTRSPVLVSLTLLLQSLPWLLFGLYAGALADRVDRVRLVAVANLLRALVLVLLVTAILTDVVGVAITLVALFLVGVAEVFVDIATSTLLPMSVEPGDLGVANARLQFGFVTLNQLAGAPLGAALFGVGMAVPFGAQAGCILLAVVLVSRMALPDGPPRPAAGSRVRHDIAEGVRWLLGHPPVRTLALVIVTFNVTWGAGWSVLVLYSLDVLHMGPLGYGLLTTMAAAGGVLSTLGYGWLERRVPLAALMRTCLLLEVLMHLALAVNREAWIGLLILFGFGAYAFVWHAVSQSVRQRAVPTEFQGRVGSVYMVGVYAGLVVGAGLGGVLADLGGLTAPFWFAFVGSGLTLALVWRQIGHIAHADEEVRRTDGGDG